MRILKANVSFLRSVLAYPQDIGVGLVSLSFLLRYIPNSVQSLVNVSLRTDISRATTGQQLLVSQQLVSSQCNLFVYTVPLFQ